MQNLDKFFHISERKSSVKTELLAGLTTFMSMSYILAVNPNILSATGMNQGSVFVATALSAVIATVLMAIMAKLPVALAPGVGTAPFFAFTVVLSAGYSWQTGLTAVFLAGALFIVLSLTNFREAIFNSVPMELKYAISAGIGLFIAFIGFQSGGIIINNDATLVGMGDLTSAGPLLTIIGFALISVLLVLKVTGALLIGILLTAIIGIPMGLTNLASLSNASFFSLPSISPTFFKLDFTNVFSMDMFIIVFTFFLINLFDTLGTLVGVGSKGNLLNEKGELPQAKTAFLVDAIGTCVGAVLGTATVTSYVESASGIAAGGRTGLTALTVAGLFFLALFLSPLFLIIPSQATAPALIMVGLFMVSSITKINFENYTIGIPSFLIIIGMPLTYSITYSIGWGLIAYVFLMAVSGKIKEIHPVMYLICAMFVWQFVVA